MSLAVLKYNGGNIESVLHALHRIGVQAELTDDPTRLRAASKVIFPGVGQARSTMEYLRARKLDQVLRSLQQPVLGICLGMQLLCEHSEESDVECMGVFPVQVRQFQGESLTVPHMGWNQINSLCPSLFTGVEEGSYVYFAHSFFAESQASALALSTHGAAFSAALKKDNFYGVQFHPEKSADVGTQVLRNFLSL